MHHELPIFVSPGHPLAGAVALANRELDGAMAAVHEGNDGRARVCARRAVGEFLRGLATVIGADVGPHALANLRYVQNDQSLPPSIRAAAERLLGGARSILVGDVYSSDPVGDARLVIEHYLAANGAG